MSSSFQTPALLYRAADASEASLLSAALEAEGVATYRAGGGGSITYGELGPDVLRVDIWVDESKLAAGRAVIERLQAEISKAVPVPKGEWTCSACNEVSEGRFDACWNCGAARGAQDPEAQSDAEGSSAP